MDENDPAATANTFQHTSNQHSSYIGAITAGGRSIVYQMTSFYLRTPLKLFRPARFDYLHYLRVILTGEDGSNRQHSAFKSPSRFWNPKYIYYLENSSIGLLTKALNKYGWRVIPDRVLPPLIANSATGVVLYTTYLTALNHLSDQEASSQIHSPLDVARAGFIAGTAQAIASAPIDAIYTRSSVNELLSSAKKHNNLWLYGLEKLKDIGLIGCFGGFGLSLAKECFGFAAYFTTFELIKGQVCNRVIDLIKQYRELKHMIRHSKIATIFQDDNPDDNNSHKVSFMSQREERWLHKLFLFTGGVSAALLLQTIQYPFLKLQKIHLSRLEAFDMYTKASSSAPTHIAPQYSTSKAELWTRIKLRPSNQRLFYIYYNSYLDTFHHVYFLHKNTGSLCRWLYKGFTRNTLAIIPGTTAGLLLLEYMRNSLSDDLGTRNEKLLT
ncbi:LAFE_0F11760g1_1 [Lachancea fermentati]|uniref:LAFE_0F11760g1_1 n=1 Tax=Lachancea fermentati TaxID=4955 RepID=A0A1G4MFX9_LACFM|nr:LAFE_0F11760g1_1 [Lachancea fermentati]